ncbi:phage integrase N-terminal SAM-like domain-containing protein [Marinobacter changyiensis]|uniref:phage integrase N-terminal SAM-like domain-containing protein n=1 Tax=Marinobacter changyiensis TaxID=2604091 RepID=UPI00126435D3|nr:phage integrase N-terminal SAM-like domain-containing protein [Marinobacter changyiensis]
MLYEYTHTGKEPLQRQGKQPRLRDQIRAAIRVNHYNIRTEKTYWYWTSYFIRFHQMKHPRDMGPTEVNQFLTWLAVHRNVAPATQAQALNSLVCLYTKVMDKPLGEIGDVTRSKTPRKLAVVLSHDEAFRIIDRLEEPIKLIASLIYGSGLRVTATCRFRPGAQIS